MLSNIHELVISQDQLRILQDRQVQMDNLIRVMSQVFNRCMPPASLRTPKTHTQYVAGFDLSTSQHNCSH